MKKGSRFKVGDIVNYYSVGRLVKGKVSAYHWKSVDVPKATYVYRIILIDDKNIEYSQQIIDYVSEIRLFPLHYIDSCVDQLVLI